MKFSIPLTYIFFSEQMFKSKIYKLKADSLSAVSEIINFFSYFNNQNSQ